ncbi:1-phosphatidylinositol 4,5-bisphosphate phosphodiesterase classes I and II isoform X1 [Phlebotomus papatasi]|nr:1-phosphatidylinositol 4,5-bisphosphate phosphodiesterase classes I and II isoform X1 [Phlebotomus papatasi]XP_055712185.1 1-phosphatidylinositol 4,5-bisphosphate phosphodiesterase classes I and II isoform X1 [Phlebotomus papatasi]XP_055712186.1 1-phosphatidylinositol 4,5-bisphosphate phosphodiesterase classes I and II isoform X1 [Phlebotomus papatasi]XP_055712187.1 1-phosphatidylinositol 4,5-bisphosphate phosphodiesterase classes I and II isoform X1 [Phlebotomus papatasi]XP_055712188.1 1-ph
MASSALSTVAGPAAAAVAVAVPPDSQKQQQQKDQSPRNTASLSASPTVGGNATAYVQLGAIEVSKALQEGEKFIKWDEDSGSGTPVTLRVDAKGFYLYWVDQNNEMDLLDIATVRDVRTAQYAKKPRDTKLRQIVTMGSQDTLEEKTVSVCYGADFVNVTFINFCCTRKDIAQHWSEELMRLAFNMTQLNGSAVMYLQKAHTKLCLQMDKSGKIPVKNIVKLFAVNKDDRRRVEKAMDISGFPSGKGESLLPNKFQFEDFFNLYKNLTQRTELEKIFEELSSSGTTKRRLMSTTQLVDFLNKTQRDPRLNEILHPYANPARAKDLIAEYEPNKFNAQKGLLSFDGFLRYLMSEDNPIMAPTKLDICDDMDQPLSHYFINSSHNTYLTGHQLTGKSSVEIYRQCLLSGCRCVELDFWNGKLEEPVIVHGYTFVPEITAKDVLEAIAESAFKTSDYPVILSFENHCNTKQQAKIANYCRDIFGDMLLDKCLDSHPLEPNVELPPPSMLKRKIIIKNKKKHHHHHHHHYKKTAAAVAAAAAGAAANSGATNQNNVLSPGSATGGIGSDEMLQAVPTTSTVPTGNGDLPHHAPPLQQIRQSSKESTGSSDTDSSSDDESMPGSTANAPGGAEQRDKVQQAKETEAGAEISALVNYVQPVHFSSFENSEKKNRYYEMSSFDEKQATTLLKERPIEFVNYNKHQLSRVYPAGTRFDSSNFMPQLFWNAGCQLVALNYQTLDLAMQLNQGIFEYNHRCGYLLKPEFMRRTDRRLDPFAESTVDGIIAGTVSITVLSGQFLSDKKVGTYVEVDMYGLPADTVRKKFRTKIVRDNGINPVYDEEPFVFKKVVLPELACVRITAYEEGGKFIGHRVLPVIGLCPGFRHLALRTELGQPLGLASLFLCIVVKDYVPDGLSDFAEALANPIKYQSELEKRAEQLAVLTEDMEPTAEDDVPNSCPKKELKVCEGVSGSPKHRISIAPSASLSVEILADGDSDVSFNTSAASGSLQVTSATAVSSTSVSSSVIQQTSIDQSISSSSKSAEATEADAIVAEPLGKILEHKLIREKRAEMEKKLESLRKKHDKEKVRVSAQKSSEQSDKKSKFYMSNKLVKRLSSKNISDTNLQVPPCPSDILESPDGEGEERAGITRSHSERLLAVCREYATAYREIQEKYHEIIYSTAEKVLRNSQANQMKRLRTLLEKETSEVMRKLQMDRRNEVKALALVHRDRDELVRMKREVASSLVGRGVTERVRLTQAFEKRRDELQRQHDAVRNALAEHRAKAKAFLEKESESRSCISSDGFLVLFNASGAENSQTSSNNSAGMHIESL